VHARHSLSASFDISYFHFQDNYTDISSAANTADRGKIQLRLKFDPNPTKKGKKKGIFYVHILSAKSLPNMDTDGLTDGFVKLMLLPEKGKRKKSHVINNNLNPVWDETFEFTNVTLNKLSSQQVLELTVWDHDSFTSNDFIGGLRLGPTPSKVKGRQVWMDSSITEAKHWEDMLSHPGEWVEFSHSLRPSMNPRQLGNPDLSIQEADNLATSSHIDEQGAVGVFRPRVW
jgi:hypothetical protein